MPPVVERAALPSPISRAESLWLAGAVLLGAVLRFSFLNRIAVEHFDEGVYASNFWFDEGEYPARHLYAPPLLPMAIEWTMIVASLCGIRPTGFVPMIPSLIAGMATIPSMWWVGRRWFGPTAGIVSTWLVASSDFHASYSRAALTDVPVCLFILWGVYFGWQALQTGTRRDIVLASLFTALAWWTKYNGWLPLAVTAAGGIAWQLFLPRAKQQWVISAKRWLVVAALSFLLWSPVLIGLQKSGGYTAVAANHRQYISGWSNWPTAAIQQLSHVSRYEDWLGPILDAPAFVRLVVQIDWVHFAWFGWLRLAIVWIAFAVALVGCGLWLLGSLRGSTDGVGWAMLAWICGLTAATPFYHPYPRLVLPWLMALWLGLGLAAELLTARFRASNDRTTSWKPAWVEVSITIWLTLCCFVAQFTGNILAWEDRSNLSHHVHSFGQRIKDLTSAAGYPADEAIVYVYGSPPIVFTLKGSGLPLVGPVQGFDFLNTAQHRPTFLMRTERAFSDPGFAEQWELQQKNFTDVQMTIFRESSLVKLDDGKFGDVTLWVGRVR